MPETKPRILCAIPTKNRYEALALCLQSIALQTVRPDHVTIYDDSNPRSDIREHPIDHYLLELFSRKKIEWEVLFTPGKGQHVAHQISNTTPGYDYVWRMDDDGVAEPDVLERLLSHMAPDVGAVGGAVFEPANMQSGGISKIERLFDGGNVQWAPDQGTHEVDHLYSSFLYRPGIVNYKLNMSPAAFREETIFTHRLKRAGYRLIADTSIYTYHFKNPSGGCRDQDYEWAYAWDQGEFLKILSDEWKIGLISLGGGLGDCLVLKNLLPEFHKRYEKVLVGSCYSEVFEDDPNVTTMHHAHTRPLKDDNVYAWMVERRWRGTLIDAFKEMYGV